MLYFGLIKNKISSLSTEYKIICGLAVLPIFALLLVSPDSYIYDLWRREDSAWFFMCGKAWMNGYVPYVDFADSKGPLLWLIYGIGYLFSNHTFVGVFWISCIFYAITYIYTYRTAKVLLNGNINLAAMASLLMTVFYFNPIIHYEIRAEDFNLTFFTLSLFHVSRALWGSQSIKSLKNASIAIGISMGATMLIKYNATAMIGFLALPVAWRAIKEGVFFHAFVRVLLGASIVVVPFLCYFLLQGNFAAFVSEYFCNTMSTLDNLLIDELIHMTINNSPIFLFGVLATWRMAKYLKCYRYFPLLAFVVFYGVILMNAHWAYYYNSLNCLMIFAVVVVIKLFNIRKASKKMLISSFAFILVFIFIANLFTRYHYDVIFAYESTKRNNYYEYAYVISRVKNPTIIYYNTWCGPELGMPAGALPGCKYWAKQNGATWEMMKEQVLAIKEKKSDFVVVHKVFPADSAFVAHQGYHYVPLSESNNLRLILFSKEKPVLPPSHFRMDGVDVLLKSGLDNF